MYNKKITNQHILFFDIVVLFYSCRKKNLKESLQKLLIFIIQQTHKNELLFYLNNFSIVQLKHSTGKDIFD